LKNGRLLDAAETAGFDVLITTSIKNIPDQQSLQRRTISLLIPCAPPNPLRGNTRQLWHWLQSGQSRY
jgi:hypothetical protein